MRLILDELGLLSLVLVDLLVRVVHAGLVRRHRIHHVGRHARVLGRSCRHFRGRRVIRHAESLRLRIVLFIPNALGFGHLFFGVHQIDSLGAGAFLARLGFQMSCESIGARKGFVACDAGKWLCSRVQLLVPVESYNETTIRAKADSISPLQIMLSAERQRTRAASIRSLTSVTERIIFV